MFFFSSFSFTLALASCDRSCVRDFHVRCVHGFDYVKQCTRLDNFVSDVCVCMCLCFSLSLSLRLICFLLHYLFWFCFLLCWFPSSWWMDLRVLMMMVGIVFGRPAHHPWSTFGGSKSDSFDCKFDFVGGRMLYLFSLLGELSTVVHLNFMRCARSRPIGVDD